MSVKSVITKTATVALALSILIGGGYLYFAKPVRMQSQCCSLAFELDATDYQRQMNASVSPKFTYDERVSQLPERIARIDRYAALRDSLRPLLLPGNKKIPAADLLSYFSYNYPEPKPNTLFQTTAVVFPTPWNPASKLLHIGINLHPSLYKREKTLEDYTTARDRSAVFHHDLKVEVVFNPAQVLHYRLIAYDHGSAEKTERAALNVLRVGHTITALYEIVPVDQSRNAGVYAQVDIRDTSENGKLISTVIDQKNERKQLTQVSSEAKFAAAVVAFAELLQNTHTCKSYQYDDVIKLAKSGLGKDKFAERAEFVESVKLVKKISEMGQEGSVVN